MREIVDDGGPALIDINFFSKIGDEKSNSSGTVGGNFLLITSAVIDHIL